MGKCLDLTNKYVQWLKPQVEEKTGIRLENIVVNNISEHPKYGLEKHPNNALMIVEWQMQDTVFMFENRYKNKPIEHACLGLAHELSHLLHFKLLNEEDSKFEPIESEYHSKAPLLSEKEYDKEYPKYKKKFDAHIERRKSIQYGFSNPKLSEGFAEYMSLDFFNYLYDSKTRNLALKQSAAFINHADENIPNSEIGYNFFRKVLSVIGRDKVFEVAKSPPISKIEVRMPLLYLLRRYPLQGVKNIPKFLTRSIKTKILKKKYGYAPFDFVEKGSGKGKVGKALPT
jgi:hypothetical protein